MSEAILKVDIQDNGVATIRMNRPQIHNAFDDKMIRQLTQEINKIDQDDNVKILVLAANGKSFSAGADLNWMKRMATYSWEENYQDSLQLAGLMQALDSCSKTTVAIVQGAAFGGGVGLVACCDIVIASNKAQFCLSEVKLGLIPAVISPYVVRALGERNAKRYFISAERFNAQQAQMMSLVHIVVDHEALETSASDYINSLLSNSPQAMHQANKLVDYVYNQSINEELIRETAQRIADIRASVEGKEGVAAFLEKRSPSWLNQDIQE
ncbi:enoyl-CoA hydratase/isomerase family protein [Aliikangiella sp. IMCC44653]